jgi:hypothetical protein
MTQVNPFALDTPAAPVAAPPAPVAAPAAPAPAAPAAPTATYDNSDPFDAPAPQEPKGPRIRDLYGRLLLIVPRKLEENIPNTREAGKFQDRMTADVVVLDGGTLHFGGTPEKTPPTPHTKTVELPYKRPRMYISAVGVISQCRVALAKIVTEGKPGMVLGRLGVGEAKDATSNAPYLLTLPTDADKQIARAYLANVDPFA